MSIYEKHISEPWFTSILFHKKTVEGRLDKDDIQKMKVGDLIIFINNDLEFERKIVVEITNINNYPTFQSYLEKEGLENCLPGVDTIENGLKVYYKYYTKEDEEKYQVKAITIWNYGNF
jgi:ASC-1-like (ASCH) protein